jgi:hypothetical protein
MESVVVLITVVVPVFLIIVVIPMDLVVQLVRGKLDLIVEPVELHFGIFNVVLDFINDPGFFARHDLHI